MRLEYQVIYWIYSFTTILQEGLKIYEVSTGTWSRFHMANDRKSDMQSISNCFFKDINYLNV